MNVVLDPRTRVLDGGRTLLGGDPWRVLRLTGDGVAVLRELLAGGADDPSASRPATAGGDGRAGALARRLIDAGLMHPRPTQTGWDEVTVVIPVRDRATELGRCLAAVRADAPGRVIVVDDGSADPGGVAAVCEGCVLIRLERSGGPAAARNAALAEVESGVVALLDCDCVPEPGWLGVLCAALRTDPRLGAVAPRVVPAAAGPGLSAATVPAQGDGGELCSSSGRRTFPAPGALARFAAVRSPLDLGPLPSLVRPGGRTGYVPTAALVVRREALGTAPAPFDPALRYGEDVDLVWRMIDRGWSVRYEPAAVVRHGEPGRLRPWLTRRFRYGSSAGPLARRHPERLAPVVIHPRSAAVLVAAAAAVGSPRIPSAAGAVPVALQVRLVVRRLRRYGVPTLDGAALAVRGLGDSGAALGRAATMLGPVPLAAALAHRGTRRAAIALLLASPARDYLRLRPALDPLRFTALSVADDVAYGAGVWAGSLRSRTWRPLRPRIVR